MKVFFVVWGIGAILVGMRAALGVWRPSLRGNWGGPFSGRPKGESDRVRAGATSSAGFGLLFVSLGLGAFLSAFISKEAHPISAAVLMGCVFAAFFLIIAGWLIDSRAHDAARGTSQLPGQSGKTSQERNRWIVAGCGIFVLVLMILVILFHRWFA